MDADVIDAQAGAGIFQGFARAGEVEYFAGGIGKMASIDDGTQGRGDGEAADFAVLGALCPAADDEPFLVDVFPLDRLELSDPASGPGEEFYHVGHFFGVGFALGADVFYDAGEVCHAGQCGFPLST